MKHERPEQANQKPTARPNGAAIEIHGQTWRHTPRATRRVAATSLQTFVDRVVTTFEGRRK